MPESNSSPIRNPHRAIFTFAAQAGRQMLGNGAAASEVVHALLAVTRAAGLPGVSVTVRYAEFSMSRRGEDGEPYVRFETISAYHFNYGLLTAVTDLLARFCHGAIELSQAQRQLDDICRQPPRYHRWLVLLAAGGAGAAAALLYGGDWLVVLVSFIANVVLYWGAALLSSNSWPVFFIQVASGVYAVVVAMLVHLLEPQVAPSRVIIAIILVMLAGMTSTAAIQDTISGWYMAASGRLLDGLMKTLGLVVGIKLGMFVATLLQWDLSIDANFTMGAFRLPYVMLAAAFIAVGFSIVSQLRIRIMLVAAVLSVIAYAVYTAAMPWGDTWSRAAAAFVVGLLTVPSSRHFRASPNAFAFCAILAMLPGVMIYQGLWAQDVAAGLSLLGGALGAALSLACGLMFGEYVMALLLDRVGRQGSSLFSPNFSPPGGHDAADGIGVP